MLHERAAASVLGCLFVGRIDDPVAVCATCRACDVVDRMNGRAPVGPTLAGLRSLGVSVAPYYRRLSVGVTSAR